MDVLFLPNFKVICQVSETLSVTYNPNVGIARRINVTKNFESKSKIYIHEKSNTIEAFIFFLNMYRILAYKNNKKKSDLKITYIDENNNVIKLLDRQLLRPRYYDKIGIVNCYF